MKYIFFGSPRFAEIILEKLINAGLPPIAVVCNPDRPIGRKQIITPPLTKLLAQKYDIPVFQPEVLSNLKFKIQNLKFDFFLVAAYAKIIPKEILEIPQLGSIGVHPSLLPKYRGSSPIQTAILNNEKETGVTLYLLDEKIDNGKIISNLKSQISNLDTYETLSEKLAELSGNLLIKTIPDFINGKIKPQQQDELQATFTKKFQTEDGFIEYENIKKAEDNGEKAVEIDCKIRALNPEPGIWTLQQVHGKQKRVKLLKSKIIDGKLKITKIQKEGKNPQEMTESI